MSFKHRSSLGDLDDPYAQLRAMNFRILPKSCGIASLTLLANVADVSGAGVTIITHGFRLGEETEAVDWLDTTALAIADQAGGRNKVPIYGLSIAAEGYTPEPSSFRVQSWLDSGPAAWLSSNHNGEIVIKVNWSDLSGRTQVVSTTAIAERIADYLSSSNSSLHGLELPLHLIGHSRGASVMAELAHELARRNIWVDQLTLLDPNSAFNRLVWGKRDRDPTVSSSVFFCDSYFQHTLGGNPNGIEVGGAYNRQLKNLDGHGYSNNHRDVHFWYFGTVNWDRTAAYVDGHSMSEALRDLWYPGWDETGDHSGPPWGYDLGRIRGEADRPKEGIGLMFPLGDGERVIDFPINDGTAWPNIRIWDPDDGLAVAGTEKNVRYIWSDTDSHASLSFAVDSDQNPFNNFGFVPIDLPIELDRTDALASPGMGSFRWTPTPSDRFLYARIQDQQGHTRYCYLPKELTFIGSAPARPTQPKSARDIVPLSTLRWDDREGDGDGNPEAGERVEMSIRVANCNTSQTLRNVLVFLSVLDPSVEVLDGISFVGDLAPTKSGPGSEFEFRLGFTSTRAVTFRAHATYLKGGEEFFQDWEFPVTFYGNGTLEPRFEIGGITADDTGDQGNGNGVVESGENPCFLISLRNVGSGQALDVSARLTACSQLVWRDEWVDYPDMGSSSAVILPRGAEDFDLEQFIPRSFAGPVYADIEVTYRGAVAPFVIRHVKLFDVAPTAWLFVAPKEADFGILPTTGNGMLEVSIRNAGSASALVSGLTPSHPDLTWLGPTLPWMIEPGQSQLVTVTLATSALQGPVSRALAVSSNARIRRPGEDDQLKLAALVGDALPGGRITAPGANNPDIGGDYVVWESGGDIFAYNLKTGAQIPVCTHPANQSAPFVSGNLVAWRDTRNTASGQPSDYDVYAFDLVTRSEFPLSVQPGLAYPIGVDGAKIAFVVEYSNKNAAGQTGKEVFNLWLYDHATRSSANITDFSPTASFQAMGNVDGGDSHLHGGALYWRETRVNWSGSSWNETSCVVKRITLANGLTAVSVPTNSFADCLAADGDRAVWKQRLPSGGSEQVYLSDNGIIRAVTSNPDEEAGDNNVALGGNYVIYDYSPSYRAGLVYFDVTDSQEKFLYAAQAPADVAMDGPRAVWVDNGDPGTIYYAYLGVSALSVSPANLEMSTTDLIEGGPATIRVVVHNLSATAIGGPVTVSLHRGDPRVGGPQIGASHVIDGGIHAHGSAEIIADIPVLPVEGTYDFYVQATAAGFGAGLPGNNLAALTVTVLDSDTVGPEITSFQVTESPGDGDGYAEAAEPLRLVLTLVDPAGVGNSTIELDGTSVSFTRNGDTFSADLPPQPVGDHQIRITALDGDISPATAVQIRNLKTLSDSDYAPTILTQPTDRTIPAGQPVTFEVNANGALPLHFQWRKDATNLEAATNATFSITNVEPQDGGSYSVVVTNSVGSVTSLPFSLIVATAPQITAQPVGQTVNAGESLSFTVIVSGTAPLSYQWRKDGVVRTGATNTSLLLTNAQPADSGSYDVVVSNGISPDALSTSVVLNVIPTGVAATHAVISGDQKTAGGPVIIRNQFAHSGPATNLQWSVLLPTGWSFASSSATGATSNPSAGATGLIEWSWTVPPVSPVAFTYTLNSPAGDLTPLPIAALAKFNFDGTAIQITAKPDPLMVGLTHSADIDHDSRISLTELLRVIEIYNTRYGTVRTGAYQVNPENLEDGFDPEPTRSNSEVVTLSRYHSGDINHDAKLSLTELLRVIELYNHRSGTVRTGQYHVQSGTEDGFATGP